MVRRGLREPANNRQSPSGGVDVEYVGRTSGCVEIARMLTFRDWLRSHGDDRILYEQTKRELASRTWKHVHNYADAKTAVVETILARALGMPATL